MTLDFLIPHWQETPDVMEPLLGSIALQQGVDLANVGVIIAYDGPDAAPLPDRRWKELYPFRIIHTHAPKGGVSATRNAALDASNADYVMFCDSDDMLHNMCGLQIVFEQMGKGFDALVSTFMEQTKMPGTDALGFVPHVNDVTFVHGKVYRREYLIDKNIRFNPALTVHEDSYFNVLARECAGESVYCQQPFYLWRWRDESVCRHDPKYILKTFDNMLDSNDALIDEFVRRGMLEKAAQYAVSMVWDSYYTMNKPEWRDCVNREHRRRVERRFRAWFVKHGAMWRAMDEHQRLAISVPIRQRQIAEGMLSEAVTPEQWLRHVMAKDGNGKKKRRKR